VIELPLVYPVTTEIDKDHDDYRAAITGFYEESAQTVAAHLDQGRTVAILSEGDPLFYGSYMHLHIRLSHLYPTEVIPGVTAMSGCWSQTGVPIVQGDDVLSVLPGTMSEFELTRRLADTDAAVIMKVGRNLPKIRKALAATGKLAAPSMSSAVPCRRRSICGSSTNQTTSRPISPSCWCPAGPASRERNCERPPRRHRPWARQS
jgi:precorrin-2/cobalt-factor-2 C20-methyltransferase